MQNIKYKNNIGNRYNFNIYFICVDIFKRERERNREIIV